MSRFPMSQFAKPENALKRAEELIHVGQKQAALQALHDVITSKRHRTWQKTLEKIMFKYVELCVDMRKGRFAKDGLIQYRIVCQQVNVSSLEEVIKYFLKLSNERAERAQSEADEVKIDVDDLEAEKRPEDLMLSFVSGEKESDRTDRELVTPWFKFLWETYRTVLEILRNNSKLEQLYAMTAHRAFHFCLQYKRTTEFRRLCEILRSHLANLNKYREQRDQRDRTDLTQPESLNLYLETRFEQLKVATELELWQEAFRSIEDIHGLLTLVKKSPKPQMMATYYAKLTKIFWVSGSYLYHGYAWYKLYNLSKSFNKNLTAKDLQLMASSVLLATLSIPPYDRKHGAHHFELEMDKDRNIRMAALLGFSLDPKRDAGEVLSRNALLSEILAKGILQHVPTEVRELYSLLETGFHPLDLCARAQPLMAKLQDAAFGGMSAASPVQDLKLEQYVPALERLTTLRLLQQVSSVYATMKIENLSKMILFFSFEQVEALVVDAVRYNFLQMRINHQARCVEFGAHALESDRVRNHLVVLAKRLSKAVRMVYPEGLAPEAVADRKAKVFNTARATVEAEHKSLLARKVIIEKKKEEQERQMLAQEKEEEVRKLKQARLTEEAEAKRLAQESARREEERIRKEIEEKELEETRALIAEQERRKGKKSRKGGEGDGPLKLDKRALMEEAISEQIRERQELERKLAKLSRTMDYLERARREEERPLLVEEMKKKAAEDAEHHRAQWEVYLVEHHKQYEADHGQKKRLARLEKERLVFQKQVMARRREEFERLQQARAERLAELRAIRRQQRDIERRKAYYRQMEEARVRAEIQAEEDRKAAELAAKRAAEKEREEKLAEIARIQREKEEEVERKLRAEKAEAMMRARGTAAEESSSKPAAAAPAATSSAPSSGAYQPPSRRGVAPGGGAPAADDRARRDDAGPRDRDMDRERDPRDRDGPARGGVDRSGPYRGPAQRGGPPGAGGGDRWTREDRPGGPPGDRDRVAGPEEDRGRGPSDRDRWGPGGDRDRRGGPPPPGDRDRDPRGGDRWSRGGGADRGGDRPERGGGDRWGGGPRRDDREGPRRDGPPPGICVGHFL
eukprot:jgi/Mesvir1/496/Mv11365-RA.2